MSAPELTPWFKWPAVPARVGDYEFRGAGWQACRMHWNGRAFGSWQGPNWVELADDESDEWRGLASADPLERAVANREVTR